MQTLDSVASSALWSLDEKPQAGVSMNTAAVDTTKSNSDTVYPPWRDAPRDSRGLPCPMQPKDLGPDEKWRVIPATDKQIQDTMEQINILGNDQLDEAMVLHWN